MEKEIKILIIDNSESNSSQLIKQITAEGYAPRFKRVDTPTQLAYQISNNAPDIIIAKYPTPRFSSKDVIDLIKNENMDIPIIVVSESMSEKEVVDVMRAGVHDVVLQVNITRLAPVIERELRETEIRSAKRIADKQLEVLSQAVEQSRNLVFISDDSALFTYVNSSFRDLTGYSSEEVIGQTATLLDADNSICFWSNNKICCSWHEQQFKVATSGDSWRGEVFLKRKDGTEFWALVSISPIKNAMNEVINLVNVGEDLSELKAKESELARMAFYDSVTGLANRRLLEDRLQQQINLYKQYGSNNRASDNKEKFTALLSLDLDKFKQVNDKLGHGEGDNLLRWVSEIIESSIRNTVLSS